MTNLSYDAIENMSGGSGSGDIPTGYDESAYFTINSVEDADTFSSRFHHSTDSSIPSYYDSTTGTTLQLGNRININDGTYNTQWMIAGFDVEYSRTASNNVTYNNGYGIALIPVAYVEYGVAWNTLKSSFGSKSYAIRPYATSSIRTGSLSNLATALQNVLGDHLVKRTVILADQCTYDYDSEDNYYSWSITKYGSYTDYATLLTRNQLNGTGSVDDGEANYKLPLFDSVSWNTGYYFWTRNYSTSGRTTIGHSNGCSYCSIPYLAYPSTTSFIGYNGSYNSVYVQGESSKLLTNRPMIYIR